MGAAFSGTSGSVSSCASEANAAGSSGAADAASASTWCAREVARLFPLDIGFGGLLDSGG